jgi:hypothetical protein
MNYLDLLKGQFNNHVALREKRPNSMQLLAPLYHEDGDMIDMFLESIEEGNKKMVRICDHGLTLMRLSYTFELDTQNKRRIFQKILTENGITEESGNLFLESTPERLYPAVLQFAQTVAKVSSLELLKRELIEDLFYDMLVGFVEDKLVKYSPSRKIFPLPKRDDLEVDFKFDIAPRPIFLFGVKDKNQARLTAISCLEFQKARIPFRSFVVHKELESLPRKDITRITSAADKQFPNLEDFQLHARQALEREIA